MSSTPSPEILMRVLHIDDSPDNRELLKQSLEGLDPEMEVVSVSSPSESLRIMGEPQIDCIISDYIMPEMDGLDLCRKIRGFSDVPFIIYTGQGSEEIASVAFEAGASDYIRKEPGLGHYRVLANRVRQAVEKHWGDGLYRNVLENTKDGIVISRGTGIVYANRAIADILGLSHSGELIEMDSMSLVSEKDRGMVQSIAMSRQRGEPQPPQYEIEFNRADGERRVVEVSSSQIQYEGRPASLSVIRDVSENVRNRERLQALLRCTIELSSTDSVEEVAKQTFESIEEVFDFRWGDFFLYENERLVPVYNKGFEYKELTYPYPNDKGIVPRAVRTGETQLVPDTRIDKDYVSLLLDNGSQMLSELAVPFKGEGSVIGVINLESPVVNGFTPDDARLIELYSQYVASAVIRIRNEGLLKKSEEKHRNILESSMDGITVTRDSKIIFANQRFAEMLGWEDPSELQGRSTLEFFTPEFTNLINERRNMRREGDRSTFRYDMYFLGRDGKPFYVESRTSPIDFEGEPAFLGIHRDTNERKRLDTDLRDSEARWRTLVALAPDGIITFNPLGFVTSINEVFVEMTGFSKDEVVGKHFTKLGTLRARDMPTYEKLFSSLLKGQTPSPHDFEYRHKDDSMKWGQAHMRLIKSGDENREVLIILREVTERKRLEKDLQESEERYKSLFDLSPYAIVISDMKGQVTDVNKAVAQLSGYHKSELIGKHFSKLPMITKREIPRYLKIFSSFLNGKFQEPVEIPVIAKDGTQGTIEMHVGFIERAGKKTGIQAVFKNVTLQKEVEKRLQRENAEKKATLDAIPDAVSLKGTDYRFIWVNDALARSASTTPEELVGKVCYKAIYGRKKPHEDCPFRKVLESGQGHRTLMTFMDDHVYDVAVEPIHDSSGKIVAAMEIARNISTQKQMEEELQRSEERYRSLIELAPDGIMTLNLKGEVTSVNTAFANLTGYSENEIVGQHFTKLQTAASLKEMPKYVKMFTAMLRGKTPPIVEFDFKRKDGTLGRGESRSQIVEVEPGKREILTIQRDITDRKRLEDQLREYTRNLEGLVEERTQELVDAERLVTAGKVSAMVGHDLRGPLVVIRNAVELARKDPEKTDRMLNMIDRNAGQAIDILEELRTITRDEPVSLVTMEIRQLLNSIIEDTILPPGVELYLEIDEDLPKVILDEAKTIRAMQNLIENAKDAMPGGGALTIGAKREDDQVVFSVSDTGTGIADEDHENIFKPFYTTKPKGLGLGLPSTRRMIEAQGGTILFESNEDKGTTFSIYLPLKKR